MSAEERLKKPARNQAEMKAENARRDENKRTEKLVVGGCLAVTVIWVMLMVLIFLLL